MILQPYTLVYPLILTNLFLSDSSPVARESPVHSILALTQTATKVQKAAYTHIFIDIYNTKTSKTSTSEKKSEKKLNLCIQASIIKKFRAQPIN